MVNSGVLLETVELQWRYIYSGRNMEKGSMLSSDEVGVSRELGDVGVVP